MSAHPHAIVLYSVVLPLGDRGIESLGFVFTFDPLYSAVILADAGRSGAADTAAAHARILRQLPYEIEVTFNGAPVALEAPTDLQVTTGAQVTYRFRVPLAAPLTPPGTLDLAVEDHGYFLAFALRAGAPVEVLASGTSTASCERARQPSGAPGPLRCDYRGPGPPEP